MQHASAEGGAGGLGDEHRGKLASLLGAWKVQEWQGMDKFLEDLRFPAWKRALAARAGQQYVLQLKGGGTGDSLDNATLRIVTSDLRGRSELELPLSSESFDVSAAESATPKFRDAHGDQDLSFREHFNASFLLDPPSETKGEVGRNHCICVRKRQGTLHTIDALVDTNPMDRYAMQNEVQCARTRSIGPGCCCESRGKCEVRPPRCQVPPLQPHCRWNGARPCSPPPRLSSRLLWRISLRGDDDASGADGLSS